MILPSQTIGIIGGGQLGRMLAIAAKQMGYQIAVLDPNKNGPCAQVADYEINTAFDDELGLKQLSEISAVITYEFENIPHHVVHVLQEKAMIPQGYKPLMISQNRKLEKRTINEKGFKTVDFCIVKDKVQLLNAIKQLGYPCVLKSTTGGYDGKGQVVLKTEDDLEKTDELIKRQCILEKYIHFKKEISAIVVRSTKGEIDCFPISENIHVNNILSQTIVPARIRHQVEEKARKLAISFIRKFDFVGTVAIEMFLLENDDILINEIAPRVHNSGHYSIDACETSQFEQHIRAICGLKLGNTNLTQKAVMVNILGQDIPRIPMFLKEDNCKLHLYGKAQIKENRKMGHVTFIGDDQTRLINQVNILMREDINA